MRIMKPYKKVPLIIYSKFDWKVIAIFISLNLADLNSGYVGGPIHVFFNHDINDSILRMILGQRRCEAFIMLHKYNVKCHKFKRRLGYSGNMMSKNSCHECISWWLHKFLEDLFKSYAKINKWERSTVCHAFFVHIAFIFWVSLFFGKFLHMPFYRNSFRFLKNFFCVRCRLSLCLFVTCIYSVLFIVKRMTIIHFESFAVCTTKYEQMK